MSPTPDDPNHTIFDRAYQAQPGSNIDLGYLIIAILVLVNVFMWFFWSFIFGGDLSENRNLYKMIRVLSTTLSIAQFAVMFIFAKRPAYKIVIGIIGGIIIIYDFYYLALSLSDNKY
ncbi:MAG TPA: hypothetical protein VIS75_16695 [Chitinophagaceae bacterium]